MEGGLRHRRREMVGRAGEAQRIQHALLHQLLHRLPGGGLQRQAEDEVVGVGVFPVGARREQARLGEAVGDDLVRGEAPERVGQERVQRSPAPHVVAVAGGHVREHPEGGRVRLGQVGQVGGDRVVEADRAVVDQGQHQGGDEGDGDRPVPEVHVGGGRHARHRLAECLGHHLLAVDRDAEDGGAQARDRPSPAG